MSPLVLEKVKKWLELGRIDPSKAVIKHHPDDEAKFKLVRQKVKTLSDQSRAAKRDKMLNSIDKLRAMRGSVNESDEELRRAERLNSIGGLDNLKLSRMKERVHGESPFKRFTKRLEFLKDAAKKFYSDPEKVYYSKDKANNSSRGMGLGWTKDKSRAYRTGVKLDLLGRLFFSTGGDPQYRRKLNRRQLLSAIRLSNAYKYPYHSEEGQRAAGKFRTTTNNYTKWLDKNS